MVSTMSSWLYLHAYIHTYLHVGYVPIVELVFRECLPGMASYLPSNVLTEFQTRYLVAYIPPAFHDYSLPNTSVGALPLSAFP